MAIVNSEMPPLNTADTIAGPTTQPSTTASVGSGTVDSTQTTNENIANNISSNNNNISNQTSNNNISNNNTISAAADSSDNQPSTPQPINSNSGNGPTEPTHQQTSSTPLVQQQQYTQHPIYQTATSSNSNGTKGNGPNLQNQTYHQQHIYNTASTGMNITPQQQQQNNNFPSYLNTYEHFYQQQAQSTALTSSAAHQNPQMDYINSNTHTLYNQTDYKQQQPPPNNSGVRYHPYLHNPTSNTTLDAAPQQTTPAVASSASTATLMSPRVVSSTSPSSSSNQMNIAGGGSTSSIGSPNTGSSTPQCKKCGIMCTNDAELQEHIANVHGASPYGSSGYASSPYIKDELQQQTPPQQSHHQQQQSAAAHLPNNATAANPTDLLDLDAQKMLYPNSGAMLQHQPLATMADPLHGLHTMQQRAGLTTWDQQQQQTQDGLPPYLQQQPQSQVASAYQTPKQSPAYHISNTSNNIKTEYPLIKSEYPVVTNNDTPNYITEKGFDPTAPAQQQQQQTQMIPPDVSSSPSEFPSTTTGGPQDNGQTGQQQFRTANFEPPSSSSTALTKGPLSGKAANWKSNEARRPKTYNCTACNKWFTSSGHLKRHYNTTLHKNAVNASGLPDPATLPIAAHHHPSRDPNAKSGRRGAAAAAAAASAAAANNVQNQQQPPNPVQPPEPPNSPQDYGVGSQMATGGLTPLTHYAATISPNSMYQQHYQHQQYMPQVQSTTNTTPQNPSSLAGHQYHQQQQQQQQQQQPQTVINGHPNALAGPSAKTSQAQQMSMPSSPMRGLLTNNETSTTTTTSTVRTVKNNEHMEAAITVETLSEVQHHLRTATAVLLGMKSEVADDEDMVQQLIYPMKRQLKLEEVSETRLEEQQQEEVLAHLFQQAVDLKEVDHNAVHHHTTLLTNQGRYYQYQLVEQHHQQQDQLKRLYHNSTPNMHSPHIISHQQYQEQLQQQQQELHQQIVAQDTYTPPVQQHNITPQQRHYSNMPSDISITQQQPNNMLQLQPQDTIIRTIPTNIIANILPPSSPHMQPLQQQQLTELQPLVNIPLQPQQQLDTINTSIQHMPQPSLTTTTPINNIPSCHRLYPQIPLPLDHTATYPHTITGNAEILTLDAYGNLMSVNAEKHQQALDTAVGQFFQIISTEGTTGSTTISSTYTSNRYFSSPPGGDLPPISVAMEVESSMPQPATIANVLKDTTMASGQSTATKIKKKTKKSPSIPVAPDSNCIILSSGRVKCVPCDKEFSKMCYLTQHRNSFHNGEYPFRCTKCGKRFQLEGRFVDHKPIHTAKIKDHKCLLCPKQFGYKTDLERHIASKHTGIKKHACPICQKGFCRRDHMYKHITTHSKPRRVAKKPAPKKRAPKKRAPKKTPKSRKNAKDIIKEPQTPDPNSIDASEASISTASVASSTTLSTTNPSTRRMHRLSETSTFNSSTATTPSSPSIYDGQLIDDGGGGGGEHVYANLVTSTEFISLEEFGQQMQMQNQQIEQQNQLMQNMQYSSSGGSSSSSGGSSSSGSSGGSSSSGSSGGSGGSDSSAGKRLDY